MKSKKLTSRRSALRTMTIAGAAASLGTILPSRTAEAMYVVNKTYATALAVVGDRYHNPDYIKTSLNKTLVDDAGLSIDYLWEDDYLTEELLSNYKILIMFRDGMIHPNGYVFAWPDDLPRTGSGGADLLSTPPIRSIGGPTKPWMTIAQGKAIKSYINNGGSLWAFHNNSHCSNMNQDYRDVEGAIYAGHPRIRPFWVRIINKEHPITKGIDDFQVVDEQHYVVYDKDEKCILAESSYEGEDGPWKDNVGRVNSKAPSVWAYDYGKGRVCFMAPGHMITVMWNPEYEKMQKNAIKWLLRKT